MTIIKKLLTFSMFFVNSLYAADNSDRYVSVGAGWTQGNLRYITENTLTSNPSINKKSVYVINSARGPLVDGTIKYEIHPYLAPYIDVAYSKIKKGYGTFDIFLTENNERQETIDYQSFKPSIQIKSFTVANEAMLVRQSTHKGDVALAILLGYSYARIEINSNFNTDALLSNSVYAGFVGAMKLSWTTPQQLNFSLQDYLFPERITTTSTIVSNPLLHTATASYILIQNSLIGSLSGPLYNNLSWSVLFSWAHFWNVGNACIKLSKFDEELFNNPRLCVSSGDQYSLLVYLNYTF